MSSRFQQFPNNGFKLTNELGWILRDHAFSYVQARQVNHCAAAYCPQKSVHCLQLPVNIDGSNQCITVPLYDPETNLPFKIGPGCMVNNIVIAKPKSVCLDENLSLILGVMQKVDCDDETANRNAQRWIAESNPATGHRLNQCSFISVDANATCVDLTLDPATCPPTSSSTRGGRSFNRKGRPVSALQECDEEGEESTPCFKCGEYADGYIGVTVLDGTLGQNQLTFAVECWEIACDPLICSQECCPPPPNRFGRVTTYG